MALWGASRARAILQSRSLQFVPPPPIRYAPRSNRARKRSKNHKVEKWHVRLGVQITLTY